MSVMETVDPPMATLDPQAATPAQQAATTTQLPRYNHRSAVNFDDRQVENLRILKARMGSTEMGVLRTALDTLAYLNSLPVQTDPTIYLNNFLANLTQGGSHGR